MPYPLSPSPMPPNNKFCQQGWLRWVTPPEPYVWPPWCTLIVSWEVGSGLPWLSSDLSQDMSRLWGRELAFNSLGLLLTNLKGP